MKDLLHMLFGGRFLHLRLGRSAHHLVDGADDVHHLCLGDEAVIVYVVEAEDPLKLLLRRASGHRREGCQEVLFCFYFRRVGGWDGILKGREKEMWEGRGRIWVFGGKKVGEEGL